jgi:hypothetical protein
VVEVMPCVDRDCPGEAELEFDGAVRYYECPVCGSEFGYQQVAADDACGIGVPEQVRRAVSFVEEEVGS